MTVFHTLTTSVFDVLLAPLGHAFAALDLLIWPVLGGIVALVVYKYASNQGAIIRAKDRIRMHLYEVRLYRHDVRRVLASTGMILARNTEYLAYNLVPMVVMLVPMMTVIVQLVANYALDPGPVGDVQVLEVSLAPGVKSRDLKLALPSGVALDAPPVRTADGHAFYRLRAETAGDHVLSLTVAGETLEKSWSIGGEHRKVSPLRTQSWESLLYAGEAPIPGDSAFEEIRIDHPVRELAWLPDGEGGILGWFFGISLVAGFALRGVFGVTF